MSNYYNEVVNEDWRRDFYYRVHDLIDATGMTVRGFANKHGLNFQTFYNSGSSPSIERVLLFADLFGVTTDYLLGREEAQNGNIPKEE